MRYVVADIRLSESYTKQVQVPAWELPILEAVHGAGVSVVDEIDVERDLPDARDEYKRLSDRYSPQKEDSNSAVALVYGTFEKGIDELEKAIGKADSGKSGNVKSTRMKAFDEKAKAEQEALKQRQEAERKQLERDIKQREAQHEREEQIEKEAAEETHAPRAASRTATRAAEDAREAKDAKDGKTTEPKGSR